MTFCHDAIQNGLVLSALAFKADATTGIATLNINLWLLTKDNAIVCEDA